MEDVSATDAFGRSLGILLELSSDSGATFHLVAGGYRVRGDMTALYITADNLLGWGKEAFGKEAAVKHLYEAYLRQTLFMRATFNIDLDERLTETEDSLSFWPLAPHHATRVILRDRDFRLTEADRFVTELPPDVDGNVNDTNSAIRLGHQQLCRLQRPICRGNPIVPWLAITEWPIGTAIRGIRRGRSQQSYYPFSENTQEGAPHVAGKIFRVDREVSTELVLADFRFAAFTGPI
jgi:hypothetical protein